MSIPLPTALKTNRFIAAELRPNTIESDSEVDLISGISSLSESTLNQALGGNSILTPMHDYDRSLISNDPYLSYINSNKNNHNSKTRILDYNNLPNNNQIESSGYQSFTLDAKKYAESPL